MENIFTDNREQTQIFQMFNEGLSRQCVQCLCLIAARHYICGTYTSNTTRCVFLMVSARKHATRRRTAYNQHSDKLRSAYVLRVDSQ